MTGGSQQLRLYRRARDIEKLGTEAAAERAGIGLGEARLHDAEDAKNPPTPEAYKLLSREARRVEIIGDATLILGDARQCAQLASADAIITDPVWPNCPPDLLIGAEDPVGLLRDVLAPLSPKRAAIVLRNDSDPRFLASVSARWRFVCLQALAYVVPSYIGRVLGGTEIAYGFGEPIPVAPGRRLIPMWGPKAQPSDRPPNGHPCSRAQVHMDWLVSWWSTPGEVVADPFMGSGTTALAALKLGRRFVGVEIDPDYFDLACCRVEEAQRSPQLFRATA